MAGGGDPLGRQPKANSTYHDIVRSHAAQAARVPGANPAFPTEQVVIGAVRQRVSVREQGPSEHRELISMHLFIPDPVPYDPVPLRAQKIV